MEKDKKDLNPIPDIEPETIYPPKWEKIISYVSTHNNDVSHFVASDIFKEFMDYILSMEYDLTEGLIHDRDEKETFKLRGGIAVTREIRDLVSEIRKIVDTK